jgi:hypothetical protein
MDQYSVGKWVHVPTTVDWADLTVSLPILVLCALAGLGIYHLFYRARQVARRSWYKSTSVVDPANQLRYVSAASFTKKKVMNGSEYGVFKVVEEQVLAHQRSYRVMAQTSLGEIITSTDRRAFESINSKRVDILVVSPTGHPIAAIECQGAGHYQRDDTAARDAVKREALRRAGVEFVEIFDRHSAAEVAQIVRELLSRVEGIQKQSGSVIPWRR